MPVGEIAAAVTGIRAALDITKAMVGLRDAEAFRAKSIELQGVVMDAFEKAIEAREAHSAQVDRIRALEAEVADLKAWDAEKKNYELKPIGQGAVARILKPDARGSEHPHWLVQIVLSAERNRSSTTRIRLSAGTCLLPAMNASSPSLLIGTSPAGRTRNSGLFRICEWPISASTHRPVRTE